MLETASKSKPSIGSLIRFIGPGAETSYTYGANSNRLLGFTQTLTKVRGTKTLSTLNTNVAYTLDANGALTSDGLRDFEYDEANRLAKVKVFKDGEAAKVRYLHNALGQRVFKGEPEAEQTLPNEAELGQGFIDWLRSNFKWLFASAQANTSIGTAYLYADPSTGSGQTGLPVKCPRWRPDLNQPASTKAGAIQFRFAGPLPESQRGSEHECPFFLKGKCHALGVRALTIHGDRGPGASVR